MTFAGCDYSTRSVDIVLIPKDGNIPAWHRFDLEGHDAFERTRSVSQAMPSRGWWEDASVVALGIEEPQGVQKATVAKLKAIQGAVLACLPASLLVQPFMPSEWRRVVGLPGNCDKLFVRRFVETSTAAYFSEQDACDAYCLALAVASKVRDGEPA